MSKLFNYGASDGNSGWSERTTFFIDMEIDRKDFKDDTKSSENPRVAVPSPYARFQIVQEAFAAVNGEAAGRKVDDRDLMLVSQTLDIFELLFENGLKRNKLTIMPITLNEVTEQLQSSGKDSEIEGMRLFGETLKDYAERETFGIAENPELFIIHRLGEPLAITSPTSGWLPTPNYMDWKGMTTDTVMLNGSFPIFSHKRNLIERKEEFVLFVYAWMQTLEEQNENVLPAPLREFGKYLETQKEQAPAGLKEKIINVTSLNGNLYSPLDVDGIIPMVWNTRFYTISQERAIGLIEKQSDLRLASTVEGASNPLVLTTNNANNRMVYTSGNTYWNRKNPGFSYADANLKDTPIANRTTLPNGEEYSDGFLMEHDFLADVLVQVPYKLNDDVFFNGNLEGLKSKNVGFLPPIKEEYFDYFTIDDLKKSMKMVVSHLSGDLESIDKVEVYLNLPTTSRKSISLKKTYTMANSIKDAIESIQTNEGRAEGLIAPACGVALNALPFTRAFDRNYYAFQLLVVGQTPVSLKVCTYAVEDKSTSHDVTKYFHEFVMRTEGDVPSITNYVLDGGNFDYMKLIIQAGLESSLCACALLLPKSGIKYYAKNSNNVQVDFCFDFGTSNTYVAIREDGKINDFTPLNTSLIVSTISDHIDNADRDTTIESFMVYRSQNFLPEVTEKENLFPTSSVLSVPKYFDESAISILSAEQKLDTALLASNIPFIYGFKDHGRAYNDTKANLKWWNKDTFVYTQSFINELMLLAQVYAMENKVDLGKCRIYWTYPLSMNKDRISKLQKQWIRAYLKFFKGVYDEPVDTQSSQVISFPESMAPMLYLIGKRTIEESIVTADIGGGTCDLVIIPDSDVKKLKLASIHFGADDIFGLEEKASDVKLFKGLLNWIKSRISQKANANNSLKDELERVFKDLSTIQNSGASVREMATLFFNLPNHILLKDVSINQRMQDLSLAQAPILYYYAALIFYIAEVWKAYGFKEKPTKMFFSGSGSKMLNSICGGNEDELGNITDELFNLFVRDSMEKDRGEDNINIKLEHEYPKQITARGVLTDVSNKKLSGHKQAMESWNSAKDGKDLILQYQMLGSSDTETLTYGNLQSDGVVKVVCEKIVEFHSKLSEFVNKHGEEFAEGMAEFMKEHFFEYPKFKNDNKMRETVIKILRGVVDNESGATDDTLYPDAPFFAVVKNLLKHAIVDD